jgi:hypothetical protein
MNLETLKGKRIVLFGSPRALSKREFERLLQAAGIEQSDRYGEEVAAVIEGRLVDPIGQETLERLYAEHGIVPVDIATFEHALCTQLNPDRILMSLKLSRDHERLHAFLQNPYIDDAFFLRLLKMYNWQNEGFFGSDENRDVTAALIGRFYDNLERNHNIQYSTLGLMHLVAQNRHPELIRLLGTLPPLRHALDTEDRQLRALVETLALHPATEESTLTYFIRRGDDALRALIAGKPELPCALQSELSAFNKPDITAALAANPDLDPSLADTLFVHEAYAKIGYAHIRLDEERFARGLEQYAASLAANPTLSPQMQRRLTDMDRPDVLTALAANPALDIADTLARLNLDDVNRALAANPAVDEPLLHSLAGKEYDAALASNPVAPASLLETLFGGGDPAVLLALAANPATPLPILQQLQLDARFERAVRGNDTFGDHIKREQVGWL